MSVSAEVTVGGSCNVIDAVLDLRPKHEDSLLSSPLQIQCVHRCSYKPFGYFWIRQAATLMVFAISYNLILFVSPQILCCLRWSRRSGGQRAPQEKEEEGETAETEEETRKRRKRRRAVAFYRGPRRARREGRRTRCPSRARLTRTRDCNTDCRELLPGELRLAGGDVSLCAIPISNGRALKRRTHIWALYIFIRVANIVSHFLTSFISFTRFLDDPTTSGVMGGGLGGPGGIGAGGMPPPPPLSQAPNLGNGAGGQGSGAGAGGPWLFSSSGGGGGGNGFSASPTPQQTDLPPGPPPPPSSVHQPHPVPSSVATSAFQFADDGHRQQQQQQQHLLSFSSQSDTLSFDTGLQVRTLY